MMYISLEHFVLFTTAATLLALIPGIDVMYIASQSLIHRRNGVLAVLGTSTGIAIYILLSILGLSIILQNSPLLYNIIKIAGALYLVYLAIRAFFAKQASLNNVTAKSYPPLISYLKGLTTNLLNPKIGIFFITFLPQFVTSNRGHEDLQLLILGACFMIIGATINIIYVLLFYYLKNNLLTKLGFTKWLDKIIAIIFVLMALQIIFKS